MIAALAALSCAALLLAVLLGRAVARQRQAQREIARLRARAALAEAEALRARQAKALSDNGVRVFTKRFVAASEAALSQVAAELHDAVAQPLMLARYSLSQVPVSAGFHDQAPTRFGLGDAEEYVQEAERAVRELMSRARAPRFDGGLAQTLHDLAEEMERRYDVRVTIGCSAELPDLDDRDSVTVYRFVQEALMNVVKHAEVDAATVSFAVEDGLLEVVVRDEGVGFDPSGVRRDDSGHQVGLELLRDRAAALGSLVTVDSAPGAGTTLTLRLLVLRG